MKKVIFINALLLLICSCEDVIEVDLDTEAPRLVIDASINWFKDTIGNEQEIKLSLSAPFFDENIPPANNAEVSITDGTNNYVFIEEGTSGVYKNTTFNPIIGQDYTLNITYNGESYTATETMISVVPFDFIEQTSNGGVTGEDIELKAYFTDPFDEENYYFFEFQSELNVIPTLEVIEDRFTNGNQMFGYYSDDDLESGNVVTISNFGVSDQFYDFMFILLQQSNDEGGGPFETQPATVRGNCVNMTNPDNFPFGYFRLSEVDKIIYTVE